MAALLDTHAAIWYLFRSKEHDPASSLIITPIDSAVALAVQRVSRDKVPDMPDRIIAATAICLDLPLVTRDHKIHLTDIKTIW